MAFLDQFGLRKLLENIQTYLKKYEYNRPVVCRFIVEKNISGNYTLPTLRYADDSDIVPISETLIDNTIIAEYDSLPYRVHLNFVEGFPSIKIPECIYIGSNNNHSPRHDLKNIELPEGLIGIESNAFSYLTGLKNINIPNSVQSIGENAFYYCNNLPVVEGIRYADTCAIGAYSYTGTPSIREGTRFIGSNAFSNLSLSDNINIPDSVIEIGVSAFEGNNITSITLPANLKYIRRGAFCNNAIKSITIPSGVRIIEEDAFADNGIKEVRLSPDEDLLINDYSLCGTLDKVYINQMADIFYIRYSFDGDSIVNGADLCYYSGATATQFTTNSLTTIPKYAFYGCKSLEEVNVRQPMEEGVFANCANLTTVIANNYDIGDRAFEDCDSLTSVTIGYGVITIGDGAFAHCSSLTSVTIGDSVTDIGSYAFYGCSSLTSVTIPEGVITIEFGAFNYCSSLTSVYCKATTPPVGDSSMFRINASGRKIYVPMESVEAYKSAQGWSEYADNIIGYNFN